MAWVAFDRGIRADGGTSASTGRVDRWRAVRRSIHEDVCTRGFDPQIGSFVQSYGSKELDASLLLLPTVGFLPAERSACARHGRGGRAPALRRRLPAPLRHAARVDDGLPGGEGAFLACSFWLADAYVLMDRVDDARRLFERLLGAAQRRRPARGGVRHRAQRLVGNFPQAFSHVALVNTAHNLARATKPAEQRSAS